MGVIASRVPQATARRTSPRAAGRADAVRGSLTGASAGAIPTALRGSPDGSDHAAWEDTDLGLSPYRFAPGWLSSARNAIRLWAPPNGTNALNSVRPLRPESCSLLTLTERVGTRMNSQKSVKSHRSS